MDNLVGIISALIALPVALLGGFGFKEIVKGINERKKDIRAAQLLLIQNSNWLVNRLDSTAYHLSGDFRRDINYLAISKYLSADLNKKIADWIPYRELACDCPESLKKNQGGMYVDIVLEMKKEIVNLESKMISNPKNEFYGFSRKVNFYYKFRFGRKIINWIKIKLRN